MNPLDGLSDKIEMTEKEVSDLEYRAIEINLSNREKENIGHQRADGAHVQAKLTNLLQIGL